MNRRVLTFIIVLGMGIALGAFLLSNRSPGALAEVVQGATGQAGDTITILMCAPAGYGLANGQGPAQALVQINSSTELLDQRKRSPAKFRPEVLVPGARVRIWVTDQMLLSEPPQLVATRISLIADPVEGRGSECG
jgi:hypothetical protein